MFSFGSLSSISFATVTPSVVIVGLPYVLPRTTLRPFGPSVIFTASASWLTPRRIAARDSSPCVICFAIIFIFSPNQSCLLELPTRRSLRNLCVPLCLCGESFLNPHKQTGTAGKVAWLFALLAPGSSTSARDDSENLVLAHNQQLFTVDLDFRAAVLAKEDPVAPLNIQRLARSVFLVFSLAGRDYFAFLWLFFRAVRDDDAAANLLAFVN